MLILTIVKRSGERLTEKSPLFRKDFDRNDDWQVANDIGPISKATIKRQISVALIQVRTSEHH